MPVGCLGVGSRSHADSSLYLDNIDSASGQDGDQVSDKVDTFQLLQHKLLIQIFRVEQVQLTASTGSRLTCVTCQPWAEQCCQVDSGWSVMESLVSANSEAVWNQTLVKAVNSLTYQVNQMFILLFRGFCINP